MERLIGTDECHLCGTVRVHAGELIALAHLPSLLGCKVGIGDESGFIPQLQRALRHSEVEDVIGVATNDLADGKLRAIVHRGLAIHLERRRAHRHNLTSALSIASALGGFIRRWEVAGGWPRQQVVGANILIDGIRY